MSFQIEELVKCFDYTQSYGRFNFAHLSRLGICQKIYTTKFSDERILHTENALIETFFARDKQRKCIIISNLALFWLKLNSYYESLHLGVCKLAKYVRNCVVSAKIYTADKNFTRPPVATVATNSKSGSRLRLDLIICNLFFKARFLFKPKFYNMRV